MGPLVEGEQAAGVAAGSAWVVGAKWPPTGMPLGWRAVIVVIPTPCAAALFAVEDQAPVTAFRPSQAPRAYMFLFAAASPLQVVVPPAAAGESGGALNPVAPDHQVRGHPMKGFYFRQAFDSLTPWSAALNLVPSAALIVCGQLA